MLLIPKNIKISPRLSKLAYESWRETVFTEIEIFIRAYFIILIFSVRKSHKSIGAF